jgi:hypothetical protein
MRFSNLFSRKKPSIEEQLQVLARCGISPNRGVSASDLAIEPDPQSGNDSPYETLLCALGDTSEEEPFEPRSDSIWHLDTECIEGDGSYVRIAERMAKLSGGTLDLRDVKDHIDSDNEKASLWFTVDGRSVSWSPKVNDDWLDEKIMSNFAELLTQLQVGKRFTYYGLFGQDCLIGCATPEQLALLRKETGLKFDWLK